MFDKILEALKKPQKITKKQKELNHTMMMQGLGLNSVRTKFVFDCGKIYFYDHETLQKFRDEFEELREKHYDKIATDV